MEQWPAPVVIDTHRYFCFSDKDRSQVLAETLDRVSHELEELHDREGSISDRGEA